MVSFSGSRSFVGARHLLQSRNVLSEIPTADCLQVDLNTGPLAVAMISDSSHIVGAPGPRPLATGEVIELRIHSGSFQPLCFAVQSDSVSTGPRTPVW